MDDKMQITHHGHLCGCVHHKVVPCLVVIFGLVFLLGALEKISASTVDLTWPILVILAGLTKMWEHKCRCC